MEKTHTNQDPPVRQAGHEERNILPGYPVYPESEDIYSHYLKKEDVNPEDISKNKEPSRDKLSSNDLDIPGSELDDKQEDIGNEDEENNYYSLGGDDHDDLDGSRGD
ncbi:MAG: hypothetical protein A2W90_09495 [Bacteroidetes bacterium GWF2_42_66]|nr:MAG: hypothetical protein A2W92_00185 [Bacteroidetes bacterium GWA2_42_15]OFY01739.1 MAG: hypothetical protein A2W89_22700 [Bacteroidetes bacterium GWE2_42_39]OFY46486.1 MAG: hypothetical protein A2W90_09495 [Bacteroidetes bacterium GWF2_42_66]HAZ02928.1 hypothetical protein [Marinilabiliales bacterium]HBL76107.1 hypothetical protein [Prolixibacteraceae bacterium]